MCVCVVCETEPLAAVDSGHTALKLISVIKAFNLYAFCYPCIGFVSDTKLNCAAVVLHPFFDGAQWAQCASFRPRNTEMIPKRAYVDLSKSL